MTRKLRQLLQLLAFAGVIFLFLFVADARYRVLPNSLHNHLPIHHAGSVITDITLATCSSANPLSSCRLDPDKWHRIEKDLYLNTGWLQSAFVHVQRKQEEQLEDDDKVVVGVAVSKVNPGSSDGEKGWESRSGGLWVLRSAKRHDSDSSRVVTAVDVLFGADAVEPRQGWTVAQLPLQISADPTAWVTVRQGQPKAAVAAKPRVSKNGRFKILQVSDMHLSTGVGKCRDAIGPENRPVKNCEADPRTLDFLERILDDERPDLVILSGDQVEGPAARDAQSAILKFAAPLIERKIPYAAIFGNHDDESGYAMSREAQMSLIQSLPYSLSKPGPDNVDGVGNYYIEVLAPSPSQHSALTIYLLDSHGLTPDEKNFPGYDWVKQSQIEWFRSTATELKAAKAHAKYTHIHLDMAFIHIPLPELGDRENLVVKGGSWKEGVTAPAFNSHFFDALAQEGVVAVGCGHDHANDYCGLRPAAQPDQDSHKKTTHHGPWMCYAGGSGFGGYMGYGGVHRRMRLWEVDTNAGRIMTWKRVECCGEDMKRRIDDVVIVEAGHVVA
ncbi:Metallo-dependent phosphatase-like protein [Neohortaea acidophila]|uniref:Metallo-dependent phosphatase-like protein n=1 Tax=Neohortaea acidophila TaxID=245834 RepID=A0A6A6Q4A8_9PEZI|nr:Metallo-dependent phosphatase-like protein [Neohortaea acidophila]KAF2486483.1 Metallo-dependent phosphatase-like protein [Neohortaea acidophila]